MRDLCSVDGFVLTAFSGVGAADVRVALGEPIGEPAADGVGEGSAGADPPVVTAHPASTTLTTAPLTTRTARRVRRREAGIHKWYTISQVQGADEGDAVDLPDAADAAGGFEPEADRVAAVIRDQIIDGNRVPGSRLVERDLAAELGVSRIPVRDALKELVTEGLVTPRPRSWAVVRVFTAADIDELIEVRSALEVLAFRLAAERGSDDQRTSLSAVLESEQRASAAGDAVRARRAGADFHELVVAMAGNGLLTELFATTRSRIRWLLGQHSDLAEMADEHDGLFRALIDRDADRAGRLAQAHLQTSRRAALAYHAGRTGRSDQPIPR